MADNDNLPTNAKLTKIQIYLDQIQRNFIQFGVFLKCLSISEQIVLYYGRFSAKIFMKNKSIKFEMKIWSLVLLEGYLFSFQVYTGKDDLSDLPLRKRVVSSLPEVILDKSKYILYFGNFFSPTIFAGILQP